MTPGWSIIPQGCPAAPNIRTLVQGPGYQHVLLSSAIPASKRAALAAIILDALETMEADDQIAAAMTRFKT